MDKNLLSWLLGCEIKVFTLQGTLLSKKKNPMYPPSPPYFRNHFYERISLFKKFSNGLRVCFKRYVGQILDFL